jgi:hypothetical protein
VCGLYSRAEGDDHEGAFFRHDRRGDGRHERLDTGYGSTGELNVKGNTITGFVGGSGVSLQRK